MAPAKVSPEDEQYLQAIHNANHVLNVRGKVKFEIGDKVRISKAKAVFEKGYLPNWSTEIFTVTEVCPTTPVTYKLEDYTGKPIVGGFYNEELANTTHPHDYLVEKVIEKRGNRHFVKFLGFPEKDNAWINVSDYV